MASDDLDIPQIAVVGNHYYFNPSAHIPSPSTHVIPPTNNHTSLSHPTAILGSARNSLNPLGSPVSYISDTSSLQPPPSPTLSVLSSRSVRFANSTVLRDNKPEEYDGLFSLNLLAPPPPRRRRMGSIGTVSSIGSTSAEYDIEDSSSFRPCPVFSAHSDVTSSLPSLTQTLADTGSDVGSSSSPRISSLGRSLYRVRQSSPFPSRETTYTGSEKLPSDGQGTQQAYPVVWDLKQAADLNDHQHVNISSKSQSLQETLNDPGVSSSFSPKVSDHVRPSTADQQSVNALPILIQDVPASLPASSRILTFPDKLHPTLSSWLKNMNELSGLIDRLPELTSTAPEKYRSRLSSQVETLYATFKKQQERCIVILELSEEYATRYLLDISADIQQQSLFLEMLGKRLDMAKALHRRVIDLRRSHESRTVTILKDDRATGKATSCRLLRKNAET